MQQIYHKKNELFEVEFYKDKEYTEAFDFMNAKNLYIDGQFNLQTVNCAIEKSEIKNAQIFIPYIPQGCVNSILSAIVIRNCDDKEYDDYDDVKVLTLSNIDPMWDDEKIKTITPNLSKYIPENNNVIVFLSEEDQENYQNCFPNQHIGLYINDGKNDEEFRANNIESLISGIADVKKGNITLFLTNGTEEELEKAIEIAKELKEIYGVKEVNLFVLHWFYKNEDYDVISFLLYNKIFNKIITTTSTGILPVQNTERLQVIDCKEIFEEYLKN